MSTPSLVTCPCQNCNGRIQFDAVTLSKANNKIACPHCGLETILFIPPPSDAKMQAILSPLSPSPVISPLIRCPACNSEISPAAASCPRCGHPINIHKDRKILVERIVKVAVLVVVIGVGLLFIVEGSREWEGEIRKGIVDRERYDEFKRNLAQDLRNMQLEASNNLAIHMQQLHGSDAAHDAARKIKVATDAANNHAEALHGIAEATKAAAIAHIKLHVATGLYTAAQANAKTAAVARITDQEAEGLISTEQANAEITAETAP